MKTLSPGAAAATALADGLGPLQTIESCRQLMELCRCVDTTLEISEPAQMGMFRVLGLVSAALESVQSALASKGVTATNPQR
jgi:hypothetical protein